MMLEANSVDPQQLRDEVSPFLQSYSMHKAEAMLRPVWALMISTSSALMVSHLNSELGFLIFQSKRCRIQLKVKVFRALERLKLQTKWLYQLQRWAMFQKSVCVKLAGSGLARYLSALIVSQRLASLVKFIESGSMLQRVPIFFKNGVQVSSISLQSGSCSLIFFSISAFSLGQDQMSLELKLTILMS